MRLRVKCLKAKSENEIDFESSEIPISELRSLIECVTGVPANQQRLLYRGKVLKVRTPFPSTTRNQFRFVEREREREIIGILTSTAIYNMNMF